MSPDVIKNPDRLFRQVTREDSSQKDRIQAMKFFAKTKRSDLALRLFKHFPDDDHAHTWAITICGKKNHQQAMELLYQKPKPSIAAYNAALAACSTRNQGYWQDALKVYKSVPDSLLTTVTVNALMTCLVKAKRGEEARQILAKLPIEPDRNCYVQTIRALARSGDADGAFEALEQLSASRFEAKPNDYTTVAQAYRKAGNSTMANLLVNTTEDFEYWDYPGLVRRERSQRGLPAFWELGEFRIKGNDVITIGLQPNRNPRINGIRVIFVQNDRKVGFLLMKNTEGSSQLLGYLVDPSLRGRGLAKVWASVWLKLCLHAKLEPTTGLIHKPLICLTLEGLGMKASTENPGVPVQLEPHGENGIVMYSNAKDLRGVLSVTDRLSQNITVSSFPLEKGKACHLSASFVSTNEVKERVEKVTGSQFQFTLSSENLQKVLLGKK